MFKRRILTVVLLFSFPFLGLLARLMDLQLIRGTELRQMGESRRHRLVQVPPVRGRILDSNRQVLAADRRSYQLWLKPAAQIRVEGKRTIVSTLCPALTPDRMVLIAQSRGSALSFRKDLAMQDLLSHSVLVKQLAALLKKPLEEVAHHILLTATKRQAGSEHDLLNPRLLYEDIPFPLYLQVLQQKECFYRQAGFRGIEPRLGSVRIYPTGSLTGHITGYVGNLNKKEYELLRGHWKNKVKIPGQGKILHHGHVFFAFEDQDPNDAIDDAKVEQSLVRLREVRRGTKEIQTAGYFRNETVGRGGIEQYHNQDLRGRHTIRHLELARPDPNGPRKLVQVGRKNTARNGQDIFLSLDLSFQKKVQTLLEEAVAGTLEYQTGTGDTQTCINWNRLIPKEERTACAVVMDPRNGRIYAMVSLPGYNPATLRDDFNQLLKDPRKPLVNKVTQGLYPPGSIMKPIVALGALQDKTIAPDTEFLCEGAIELAGRRYRCMHTDGHLRALDALRRSCNVFFYRTGQAMHGNRLYHWYWRFGFGHRTRIDLAGEASGQLPVNAKNSYRWSLGNTYHLSIGQGPMTVTPLQAATAYALLANGGHLVRPHLRRDPQLDLPQAEVALDPKSLELVRRGLWQVVNEEGGTARRARIRGLSVAGKTGSAEHSHSRMTHAWFACYAPFENPEVVCVVLVPSGGYGGNEAAPIAKLILLEYFNYIEPPEEEWDGGNALG